MATMQNIIDAVNALIAEALASDAIQDAAVLKTKDDEIAALKKQIADLTKDPIPPDPPVPPTPTGWPDASTTGAKGTLTAYTGSLNISKAGTVIENKKITGALKVTGANVVVRNCSIESSDYWGINADGASGLLVEHTTIVGKGLSNQNGCILSGRDGKARYCDLSGFENGMVMQEGACLIEESYVHDLAAGPAGHYDCVSVQGGQVNAVVRHNTLIGWNTSAVIIKCDFGAISGTLVENNLIKNQAGKKFSYPLYSVKGNSGQTPVGTKFLNNRVEKGQYGYFSTEGTVTKTGNVDANTGAAI